MTSSPPFPRELAPSTTPAKGYPWRFAPGDRVLLAKPLGSPDRIIPVRVQDIAIHARSGFPHYLVEDPFGDRQWVSQLRLTSTQPRNASRFA